MLAITIKNLDVHLSNFNLAIEKSAICFEFLVQKRETDKQTASILYDKN